MDPLIKKLNYKEQKLVAILGAPESFDPVVTTWRELADVDTHLKEDTRYDFLIAFARTAADIKQYASQLEGRLAEDAVFWIAYPKKSSKKYDSDISRDTGWQPIGELGMEGVRQVAIDEDWSALRFRSAKHIKSMKRDSRMALSKEGRKRTEKK
ncbi:hypothetical protein [Flavilitoribacter nigricans]|uniref:DUF3052 domain-containing protein n=1 Tax=Flavilitoribacter nigricans (strain ATCC 23147 / DSM 23189 / NBRC 102662 / NCIMB 1420 / SS-2) TaxID=1122177 RepID=A0A2D0NBC4_FLAN2|nr:hypothetical protein [Flavilitoribacter nigricans]PHN05686.1 hypothetical protein CRP01_14505 [Flavilitoribacter nigricans DSM 23189 = NBRC 102662]